MQLHIRDAGAWQRGRERHVGGGERRQGHLGLSRGLAGHAQPHGGARFNVAVVLNRRHDPPVTQLERGQREIAGGRRNRHDVDRHAVRQAAIIVRLPPGLLQIRDQHHAALAGTDHFAHARECGTKARAVAARLQLPDLGADRGAVGGRRHRHRRELGERHQRNCMRRRCGVHGTKGRRLRPIELVRRRQAHRRIHRNHGDRRRIRRHRAGEVRSRERHRKQDQRRHAQREQHQLPQPAPAMLLHRRARQQLHRRKIDHHFGLAMKQVQQDGHRRRQRANQKQRRQKRNAEHQSTRRRVMRYAISPSSSGCDVSSWQ